MFRLALIAFVSFVASSLNAQQVSFVPHDINPTSEFPACAVMDVNKDGKISFQEFWDWWQYGKIGKLEKLVFMKLKMMNLMKKVHSEFTRFGSSLV